MWEVTCLTPVSNHGLRRSQITERQPQTGSVCVCLCVYNFMCAYYVYVNQSACGCCYHARIRSPWAHVLMAEVVCWSSCHVELVKVSAWPCRHDTDTSPLQGEHTQDTIRQTVGVTDYGVICRNDIQRILGLSWNRIKMMRESTDLQDSCRLVHACSSSSDKYASVGRM